MNPDGTNAKQLVERMKRVIEKVIDPFKGETLTETTLATLAEVVREVVILEAKRSGASRTPVVVPSVIDSEADRKAGRVRFDFKFLHPETGAEMTGEEAVRFMGLKEFVELKLTISPDVKDESKK